MCNLDLCVCTRTYYDSEPQQLRSVPFAHIYHFLQVMIGLGEEETDTYFSHSESVEGMGPGTRDKYLRTLIRNCYSFHLNEIFSTVQNEYSDWGGGQIRPKRLRFLASRALTDKLYVAPALRTAKWCNQTGFPVYFFVFGEEEEEFKDEKAEKTREVN